MSAAKSVWIVSVPHQNKGDTLQQLAHVTRDDVISLDRFQIPSDLRVGNIDSLISLSDELRKLDTHVESSIRKLHQQYIELVEQMSEAKTDLKVKAGSPLTYMKQFKWDESRFSTRKPLPDLAQIVEVGIAKIDASLRAQTTEYTTLDQKIAQVKQSAQGNLLTRDLTKDIQSKEKLIHETKFLTTVFIVVPTSDLKEFKNSYEELNAFVVPRSCEILKQESDYTLVLVTVMKIEAENFKNAVRQKRWTLRKYDPSQTLSDQDYKTLTAQYEKVKRKLLRWTQTNFGDAFYMWGHLKCIQVFVETLLRFGLPANFEAMILLPKKNHQSSLEKTLNQHYSYLGRDFGAINEGEEDFLGHLEKFFPYVFGEMSITFDVEN